MALPPITSSPTIVTDPSLALSLREALFTFVGKSKTDVPSVRKFGSSEVRKFGSADFGDFYQKNMRGGHMALNSEVLKHRFSKF